MVTVETRVQQAIKEILVGEIEKQAVEKNAYIEKEIDPEKLKAELEKAENSSGD